MLQALIINIKLSVPLGIYSFDSCFCYSADNKRTNKTNLQMNEQNNQTQIDLWNQQKEYDYEMWQKENEYNTPQQQVKRLQDAGINPALALSQISSGSATSSAGGQTPPQTTPGHVEPGWPESLGRIQNFSLVGKNFSDIMKQNAETDQIIMQNGWQNVKSGLEVANISRDMKLRDEALYSAKRLNQFNDRIFDAKIQQEEDKADILWKQSIGYGLDNTLKEFAKDAADYSNKYFLPQQFRQNEANIKKTLADAFVSVFSAKTERYNAETNRMQYYENVRVDDKQIEEVTSRINNQNEDLVTKKFWNSLNQDQRRYILQKTIADANNASMEPFWRSLELPAKYIPFIAR